MSSLAHGPYIKAVGDAIDAAGIPAGLWEAEANDPRTGWIDFPLFATERVYGDKAVTLLWDEERGWSVAWGEPDSQDGRGWVVDLFTGVLPTPDQMVEFARQVVAEKPTSAAEYARYRSFEDDDGFEEQLAAYHQDGAA